MPDINIPTGILGTPVILKTRNGNEKLVAVDEDNRPWIYSWDMGRWYIYMKSEAAKAAGYDVDPGVAAAAEKREGKVYDERQPMDNRSRPIPR